MLSLFPNRHVRALLQGAGVSLTIRVVGVFLLFIANILMARWMPLADYGAYAFVTSVIALAAVAIQLGLGDAALRFIPEFLATGQTGHIRRYVRRALTTIAIAAASIIGACVGASQFGNSDVLTVGLWLAAPLLPITAAVQLLQQVARGAKSIWLSQVFDQIAFPAGMICAATVVYCFRTSLALSHVMAIHLALYTLAAVALWLLSNQLFPTSESVPASNELNANTWLRVGLPLAVANFASLFVSRADILFVGWMTGDASVATYSAAFRIATLLIFGLYAVDSIAAPLLAEQHAVGNRRGMAAMFTLSAMLSTAFGIGLLGLIVFTAPWLLRLFGQEFVGSERVLIVLAVARFIQAMFGPVGILLSVTGRQLYYMSVFVGMAGLSAVALPLGIRLGGDLGAAYTHLGLTLVWNITLVAVAWKQTGVSYSFRAVQEHLRSAEPAPEFRGGDRSLPTGACTLPFAQAEQNAFNLEPAATRIHVISSTPSPLAPG